MSSRAPFVLAATLVACRGILGLRDDYVVDTEQPDAATEASTDARDGASDSSDGGSQADAFDACASVDAASDPRNCGRCGHDCLGGACMGGVCQPFVVMKVAAVYGIAVDAVNVYSAEGKPAGRVLTCPQTGCADAGPAVVVMSEPGPIVRATDSSNVYYATDVGLSSASKSMQVSSGTTLVNDAGIVGFVALDGTSIYFSASSKLWSCSQPACTGLTSIGVTGVVQHLHVDSTRVYWTESYTNVRRCDKSSCESTKQDIASGLVGTSDLAISGPDVFFMTDEGGGAGAGKLWTCPTSSVGCTPQSLATGLDKPTYGIEADQAGVYFATTGTAANSYADGKILFCKRSGCGSTPTVLADNQRNLTALLVTSASGVFWSESATDTIWGVAKP